MADHTAAEIFGRIFCKLANEKGDTLDKKKFSRWLWDLHRKKGDFSTDQMGCDEALIDLGLAKMVPDPDYPEDGDTLIAYKGGK